VLVDDLPQPVAVSAVDDGHQRVVPVEERSVLREPLTHGSVVGGHREKLLAQHHAQHSR